MDEDKVGEKQLLRMTKVILECFMSNAFLLSYFFLFYLKEWE